MFRALRQRIGLRRARHAAVGGGPIAPEVLEFFLGIGVPVLELYGLTESAGLATTNLPRQAPPRDGWSARAPTSTSASIRRRARSRCATTGTSPGTGTARTPRPLPFTDDGWLRTGDLGEMIDDTHLQVFDRIDDVIVLSDGTRLPPSEIENALRRRRTSARPSWWPTTVISLTALLGIEPNAVSVWALRRNLSVTTYRDMVEKPELVELIDDEVRQLTELHPELERITRHRLLPRELGHEDGELTAMQAVKRHALLERYADLAETISA